MADRSTWGVASTSTPAASTTSPCTTPTRSRRASAPGTCTPGWASGCTTSSSTCAARRWRSRPATWRVLDDLVARGVPPLAFRYFFLQAHYRQQQTYTDEAMEAAATGYDRLLGACAELREAAGEVDAERTRAAAPALPRRDPRRSERAARARGGLGGGACARARRGGALGGAARGRRGARARSRRAASRAPSRARAIRASTRWWPSARRRASAATSRRRTASAAQLAAEGVVIEDTPQGAALEARVSPRAARPKTGEARQARAARDPGGSARPRAGRAAARLPARLAVRAQGRPAARDRGSSSPASGAAIPTRRCSASPAAASPSRSPAWWSR